MLKKKTFIKVAKILQEMKIVVLEQLLNIEGTHLITWQQLKVSRKWSKKGKKASWYEEIEGEVLRNQESRKVKEEYKTETENLLGMQDILEKISIDKRK